MRFLKLLLGSASEPTENEAKSFLMDANISREMIINRNTNKIIHELRKEMDYAIHVGRTHIHIFFSDMDYEYDGLYDKEKVIKWIQKWERFDGFKVIFNDNHPKNEHCKLQWELR